MEKKNRYEEELQTRRDFFKKAVKRALLIFGAVLFVCMSTFVNAVEETPMGGEDACYHDCYYCCIRTCMGICKTTCQGTCRNTCSLGHGVLFLLYRQCVLTSFYIRE